MRLTRAVGALIVLLTVGAGCATRGSVRQLQADLTTLRTEVISLREVYEQHARETARSGDQIRALEQRLSVITAAVAETGEVVRRLGERIAAVEPRVRDARVESATPPPIPATATAPRETPPRPDPGEAAYQGALATFRTREYGQAVLEFMDFLARYPKHALAGNAQYWIGEAYYIQRDWRQALTEFEKVLTHQARDGTAPEALLKIGLCYQHLREPSRADQFWRRIVSEYPDSDAAPKARGLLRASATPTLNRR